MDPEVILADEPTSMLDVSVRIGVLNLMRRLRDEKGISMLYITHDLASARYVANRTTVMFAGRARGERPLNRRDGHPAHPYTQLLLSAVPDPDRAGTYDPIERARLRSAVLHATSCPFDETRTTSAVRPHRFGTSSAIRPTGTGCDATCTAPPPMSRPAHWPRTRTRTTPMPETAHHEEN